MGLSDYLFPQKNIPWGKVSDFLFGSKDEFKQLPTMTGGQQDYLNNVLAQLMGGGAAGNYGQAQNYLSGILSGDPQAFNQFAAPYIQNFEQQIIPGISERFAGMGGGLGGGATSSSGFGQALGGAGAQLQAQLANLYGNLRQNAAQQAMGQYNYLAGLGLGSRAFENAYQPGSTGIFGGIGSGIGQGAGMAAGAKIAGMFI